MNAIIKNRDLVLSKVMTMQEAEEMLKKLKVIYPNARIAEIDEPVKKKVEIDVVLEEVEDVVVLVADARSNE